MKQKLLQSLLSIVMLFIGVNAWASDETITLSSGTYSGSGTSGQIVWNGTSCSVTQTKGNSSTNVNSSYVSAPRWYGGHVITFAAKSGYQITGATITCTSTSYATALQSSTYSTGASATVNSSTVTITSSGDFTITLSAQSRISSINVSFTKTSSNPEISANDKLITYTQHGTSSTVKLSVSGSDLKGDITATLSGDDSSLFSLNSSTISQDGGDITVTYAPTSVGINIVKLTLSSTDATDKVVELTGISTDGAGTETDQYTISDVINLNNNNSNECWVKGVIVNGGAALISSSNTNGITDIAETNLVLSADGSSVADNVPVALPAGDIRTNYNISDHTAYIGAEVSVYGTLSAYYSRPGVTKTSNIILPEGIVDNALKPTLTTAASFTETPFEVTITNNEDGATVYYTIDGTDPTTTSDSFTGESKTLSITTTTTVKAIAAISGKTNSSIVSVKYTYDKDISNEQDSPYSVTEAIALVDADEGLSYSVYVKGFVSEIVYAYDSSYGNITFNISEDGTTTSKQFEVYRNLGGISAKYTEDPNIEVGDEVVVCGTMTLYNGTYEFNSGNYTVVHNKILNIGSTGYATYYNSKKPYIMPEDCEGYAATYDKKLALTRVYDSSHNVPANEPLVIYTIEPGMKRLAVTTSEDDTYKSLGMNILEGTDESTDLAADDSYYFYALSYAKPAEGEEVDPSTVGFYWMNETGAAFTNGAHKAYLKIAKSSEAKSGYAFNGETDGITSVNDNDDDNDNCYNIAGQRVNANVKGIVIKNGKKVLVK